MKNAKMIGSLLLGTVCRRKMLQEGFSELVHKCPLCHSTLPDDHKLSVKEGAVVLEPTVKRRSLDEFSEHSKFTPPAQGPATFKLLSVEVIHADGSVTPLSIDEKREGKGHDGETANSRTDEGGREDGSDDVSGDGGSDREAKAAKEVSRKDSDSSEPPEDA